MSMPSAPPVADRRRLSHRRVCVLAGGLAVAGAVLGWSLHPAWLLLTALAGVTLLLAPDPAS